MSARASFSKAVLDMAGPGVRAANPHLFGPAPTPQVEIQTAKRIRQSSKSLLNKLETAFLEILKRQYPEAIIRPQAKRYRLGNGIWYKPDFTAVIGGVEMAWEVKGPHAFRGGFENLKVAAATYPDVKWTLVWREKGGSWAQQEVLP